MDMGTHLFIGVAAATATPGLSAEQKIITVIFSLLPDSFEWLHQWGRKRENGRHHLSSADYNGLADKVNSWYLLPYNFFHNIFIPVIFLVISVIYNWPLVYGMMWLAHLLIDLPSHKLKLGLKLWWPFSQKRLHGFFDWWMLPFFRGWELWGYWSLLAVISSILIHRYWQ